MKKCNDCEKLLPDDSDFCQFCGSKNVVDYIEEQKHIVYKRCIDCGKELPKDSDFCQFCGSKRVATVNGSDTLNNKKSNRSYKIPFIICLIIAIIACCVAANYEQTASSYLNEYYLLSEKEESESKLLDEYSSMISTIIEKSSTSSNSHFFVSNTVLYKPNNTRVVFEIDNYRNYSISWTPSIGVVANSGNTYNGNVYVDITYSGKGIGTLTCTNNVNNEEIVIYCIGN